MFKIEVEPNLVLKQLDITDAAAMYSVVCQNRLRLREWHPWVDAMKSENNFYEFIDSAKKLIEQKRAFPLGIFLKNEFIGTCSINCIYSTSRIAEIGYWISKEHEGKGLVSSCVRALIKFVFIDLGFNKIELNCATENIRSQRIPIKLGFQPEGRRRDAEWLYDHYVDHFKYGLLRHEWEQINS